MRHKDPDLMKQINTFIGEFYAANDRTPSTTEIAKHFGIARSTSQNYLVAMNKKGMLSYVDGVLQVDHMEKIRNGRTQAPLVGSVPCGELTLEEANVECVTSLPTEIFGEGPFYMLHASGDSMEDEGIEGGDLTTQVASGANTYIDYLTYSNTSGFITAEGYMLDIESGNIPEGSATMTIDDVTWDAITYTPNDEDYFAEGTGNIAKILLAFDYTYTDETEATKTKRVPYIISVMGQDTYTGIDSVKADKTAKKGIYNLAGQKVNNAYKGIVIENGRKVLRK